MVVNSSPFTGAFVKLVVVLLVLGVGVGLVFANSEWLNPRAAEAQAVQSQESIRHQQVMNQLEEQERAAEIELVFQKRQAQTMAEIEYQQHVDQLAATFVFIRQGVLTAMLGMALLALIFTGGLLLARLIERLVPVRQARPEPVRQAVNVWDDPVFRRQARETARINEIVERTQKREQVFVQVPINGNGRYPKPVHQRLEQAYQELSRAA